MLAVEKSTTLSTLERMADSLQMRYDAAVTPKRKDGIKIKMDQVAAVKAMLLRDSEGF